MSIAIRQIFQNKQFVALILALVAIVFLGTIPILVRLSETGPVATAFWRMLIATIILTPLFVVKRAQQAKADASANDMGKKIPKTVEDFRLLGLTGLVFAIDMVFWNMAIVNTTVANASVLANLAPLHVAILSRYFFKTRLTRLFIFGLSLSLAGTVFLSGHAYQLNADYLYGDILAILCSAMIGGYLVMVEYSSRFFPSLDVMFWNTVSCTVFLALFIPITDGFMGVSVLPDSQTGWLVLLSIGLIGHVIGMGLLIRAASILPAIMISLLILLQPIYSSIIAYYLFGEAIGALGFVGMAFTIAGLIFAIWSQNEKKAS